MPYVGWGSSVSPFQVVISFRGGQISLLWPVPHASLTAGDDRPPGVAVPCQLGCVVGCQAALQPGSSGGTALGSLAQLRGSASGPGDWE